MLNQITLKDYEQRIKRFDFLELVTKESAADIAKAIFSKAKNHPLHSEFYVRVVISQIRDAYLTMNEAEQNVSDQSPLTLVG